MALDILNSNDETFLLDQMKERQKEVEARMEKAVVPPSPSKPSPEPSAPSSRRRGRIAKSESPVQSVSAHVRINMETLQKLDAMRMVLSRSGGSRMTRSRMMEKLLESYLSTMSKDDRNLYELIVSRD